MLQKVLMLSLGDSSIAMPDHIMTMSFTNLPTELHLEILGHLDLESLLKATATNKYFQALPKKDILRKALLSHEVVLLRHWRANQDAHYWDYKKNRNKKLAEIVYELAAQRGAIQRMTDHCDAIKLRLFPCYVCYNVFHPGTFVLLIHGTDWDLCGSKAEQRICRRCNPAKGLEFWETVHASLDEMSQKILTKSMIQEKLRARRNKKKL